MRLKTHEHTYNYNWKSATVRTPRIDTDKRNPVVDKINRFVENRANEYVAQKVWAAKKKTAVQRIASLSKKNRWNKNMMQASSK